MNKLFFPVLFLILVLIPNIPASGQNLLTNGDFSGDSVWTKETGWSISSGVASCDGSQTGATNIYQATGQTFTGNISLEVTFTVLNYSQGTVRVSPGGSSFGTSRDADGTYREIISVPTGTDTFYIEADGDFIGDIDNVVVTVANITVTSPNGGETWYPGSVQNITWTDNIIGGVRIELFKGGVLDSVLITSTPSDGLFEWNIPSGITEDSDYRIKVYRFGAAGSVGDTSDGDFSIITPTLTVTAPNGGENWNKGSAFNITWTDDITENVKIELLKSGSLESVITASTPSDGLFPWTPSLLLPDGSDFKIVITSVNNATVTDTSDAEFSLYTPTLTVTSPNGGENWQAGTTQIITWDDDIIDNIRIQLYKGGVFESLIVNSIPSFGSYNWAIPINTTEGTDYTIRISSITAGGPEDFSDSVFSIYTPVVTVTSPNGGENWQGGTTQEITWTDNISDNVKIELYKNGVFDSNIATSTPSDSSYMWNIPVTQSPGTDYKVKITSDLNINITDTSDANFTITAPTISVTSPDGGESWLAGTTQEITWSDNIAENVKIELYKAGTPVSELSASTPSDGSYMWDIPVTQSPGTDYRVKITSVDTSVITDSSDADFSITLPTITLTAPNGGESWSGGTSHDITWFYDILGNVKLELYIDDVLDSEITASTPNDSSYTWSVPYISSSNCKIKISDVANPAIFDFSDAAFTISQDFTADFIVSDNCADTLKLIFGTAPAATDCFDSGYDVYAPPPPPPFAFNASFVACDALPDIYSKDIRATNLDDETIWDVIYQRATGCDTISFNWDSGQLPTEGNFHLVDFETGGSLVYIDMRTTDNYTDIDTLDHLQIKFNYTIAVLTDIIGGFNMISLPLEVVDNNYLTLYPNAIENTLYGFNGAYYSDTLIFPGNGYWLRFGTPEVVNIEGVAITMLDLDLDLGWNLVGGPACDLPLGSVIDPGGIIIANTLYGFDGVYVPSDTFKKGVGYWIRTDSEGTITLDCSLLPPLPKGESFLADLTGFITVDVKDSKGNGQSLYFGGKLEGGIGIESYTLPPLPPAGLFDARISGGYRLSESDEIEIEIQSEDYPLSVKMIGTNDGNMDGYVIKEYAGNVKVGERKISDGTELSISNANVNLLKIQFGSIQPNRFVLEQNYPNPFNPGTIIKYELPFKANVLLKIVNSLGQEIKTLINEEKLAGSYEIEFDGSELSSGVYFYRIQVVDRSSSFGQVFDETKKMILMK